MPNRASSVAVTVPARHGTARFGLHSHDSFNCAALCRTVLACSCERSISEAGVDQGAINSVAAEIINGPHMHIFDGLKTQSQQLAYYKEHFQFVVSANTYMYTCRVQLSCLMQMPIKVVLGTHRKAKGIRNKMPACGGRGGFWVCSDSGDPSNSLKQ